ncbi:ATP-grasp domain-containing protein [Marichromatium bheemlicum]|uniref:ATP-grasp domain-containing protein n=1 Tax=Marichromatium bheemlicum TaxID=365339 RepID=A0ABX1ID08_9GAMM|nr:hypothetical protein [Marichromatium bheemlicum]NKN34065.1 hypothetical protein [Marichromatium bheemlicum]
MRLISFDPFRTLGIPGVTHLKPEEMLRRRAEVAAADWVLFPEQWQLDALLYALKVRVFPSPQSYLLGQDKVRFTRTLSALCPEHLPETLILPATAEAMQQLLDTLTFPLVVKLPRSSMGLGVHRIEHRRALSTLLPTLPLLYAQEYLDIDRDLRVVWVGDEVLCAYWRRDGDGFHHNVARGGRIDFDGVPAAPLELVTRVARHLGIDHGGFDLAEVAGHWYLIELNTRFGNAGLREHGIDLSAHILAYLQSQSSPDDNPDHPPLQAAG